MSEITNYPVLEFLKKFIASPDTKNTTSMRYPTKISQTLQFKIAHIDKQKATVSVNADPELHGNQQGTVHGGLLCELADAAIGTAHSIIMQADQSFTTIELKINFIRPSWKTLLTATAEPIYAGKTITHYKCEIKNESDNLVAIVVSTVMTLTGDKAKGR